jgi:phage terminase small subunit
MSVISMCSKAMHQIEIEFGLSPASRSKVRSLNPAQRDLFADFLDGDDDEEEEIARDGN